MGARQHHRLLYRLDGAERFLLWFTNESDGVITDADGLVPSFRTGNELRLFADRLGVGISDELTFEYDLDAVQTWLAGRREDRIDCVAVLAAWNLFDDIARSVEGGAVFLEASGELGPIYDKVFWGNNLPAVTPEGKAYHPIWSSTEARSLAEFLERGFMLFGRVVRKAV